MAGGRHLPQPVMAAYVDNVFTLVQEPVGFIQTQRDKFDPGSVSNYNLPILTSGLAHHISMLRAAGLILTG